MTVQFSWFFLVKKFLQFYRKKKKIQKIYTLIFYSKNNRKHLARKKWNYVKDGENRISFIKDIQIPDGKADKQYIQP